MIALLAASAFAQDDDVTRPRFGAMVELGSVRNDDLTYDLFSDTNALFGWGLRGVMRPASRVELRAGYHNVRHGASVYTGDYYDDTDYYSSASYLQSAFYGHEVTLGVRADLSIEDVLLPYVAVDGMLLAALVRLDDDPQQRDNPGQVSAFGVAPGAGLVGGAEIRLPPGSNLQFSVNLEVGYTVLGRMDLGDLGSMRPGGLTVRSGAGIRF
jgi:hypothetical protein